MELFAAEHEDEVVGLCITCPEEFEGDAPQVPFWARYLSVSYSTFISYTCPKHVDFWRAWNVHVCGLPAPSCTTQRPHNICSREEACFCLGRHCVLCPYV